MTSGQRAKREAIEELKKAFYKAESNHEPEFEFAGKVVSTRYMKSFIEWMELEELGKLKCSSARLV